MKEVMKKRGDACVFLLLLLLNIVSWNVFRLINSPQNMEVVFLDVGQGDAALIKTEGEHIILIDGGQGKTIIEKLPDYIPFWKKNIDLVILSHPHKDHLEGLVYVLENYDVDNVLWSGVSGDGILFSRWEELINKGGSAIRVAKAGRSIRSGNVSIDILYPFESLKGAKLKDDNLGSLILKITTEELSYFFTGDAYKETEEKLTKYEEQCGVSGGREELCKIMILKSDVLKVAHHGSRTSSSESFIKSVYPLVAVISSGKRNSYGHPHKETLEVLGKYGIKILRTDEEGDIKIISVEYEKQ